MKDLIMLDGEENIAMRVSITRENGFLSIEQFDRDAIELTREEAIALSAYIENYQEKIITKSDASKL